MTKKQKTARVWLGKKKHEAPIPERMRRAVVDYLDVAPLEVVEAHILLNSAQFEAFLKWVEARSLVIPCIQGHPIFKGFPVVEDRTLPDGCFLIVQGAPPTSPLDAALDNAIH